VGLYVVIPALVAALLVLACGGALDRAGRRSKASAVRRRVDGRVSRRARGAPAVDRPDFDPWFPTPNRVVAAFVSPLLLRLLRGRAAARAEVALPAALEAVARGLRSGASLRQAVAEAASVTPGALGEELAGVVSAADRGYPLVDGLERWARSSPRTGVRLAVAALCLGAETGGAQARAVDGVAATLRDRLAVASEVRALSSQARASMLVIAASPLAFCAFASATDPRTSTFLFRTPLGVACLTAGLSLDAAGALWMRRLCRMPS
jgi:tight adherence protein B